MTEETLAELKGCFMEAYDDNKDGKIDIREVGEVVGKKQNKVTSYSFPSVGPAASNGRKLLASVQI